MTFSISIFCGDNLWPLTSYGSPAPSLHSLLPSKKLMVAFVTIVVTAVCAFFLPLNYIPPYWWCIQQLTHVIYFTLTIDFRLEPHLFSEAAGLAFVKGAGQWDIWQVTTPWEGGGHMAWAKYVKTISENVLFYSRINSSSSNNHSKSTIRVTNSSF